MGFLDRILGARGPKGPSGDPGRIAEVEAVLAGLRPMLRQDGGDVELIAIEAGRVTVRLVGACTRCMSRETTLTAGIDPALREAFAWFERVDAV